MSADHHFTQKTQVTFESFAFAGQTEALIEVLAASQTAGNAEGSFFAHIKHEEVRLHNFGVNHSCPSEGTDITAPGGGVQRANQPQAFG